MVRSVCAMKHGSVLGQAFDVIGLLVRLGPNETEVPVLWLCRLLLWPVALCLLTDSE
jgi:hypothetical protein